MGQWHHNHFCWFEQREELDDMHGGFVAEHASVDDYLSIEEFATTLQSSQISDFLWTTRRVLYCRGVGDGAKLEVSISPAAVAPRFTCIDDELLPSPHHAHGTVPLAKRRTSSPVITRPWDA